MCLDAVLMEGRASGEVTPGYQKQDTPISISDRICDSCKKSSDAAPCATSKPTERDPAKANLYNYAPTGFRIYSVHKNGKVEPVDPSESLSDQFSGNAVEYFKMLKARQATIDSIRNVKTTTSDPGVLVGLENVVKAVMSDTVGELVTSSGSSSSKPNISPAGSESVQHEDTADENVEESESGDEESEDGDCEFEDVVRDNLAEIKRDLKQTKQDLANASDNFLSYKRRFQDNESDTCTWRFCKCAMLLVLVCVIIGISSKVTTTLQLMDTVEHLTSAYIVPTLHRMDPQTSRDIICDFAKRDRNHDLMFQYCKPEIVRTK